MTIKAVYEQGVFRPVDPVEYKDGLQVELEIIQNGTQSETNSNFKRKFGLSEGKVPLPDDFKDIPSDFDEYLPL